MKQAEDGINELKKYVDSLIVIPNEKLLEGLDKPLTMKESFALADDILKTGVKSISDLIVEEGYINLDFADVSTIMKGAGYAHMAIGHGSGKDKAKEAAAAVIASPLLETSIAGAKRLLINIAMSEDILSSDVDTATKMITDQAAENVEFIFGTAFKENMQDEMMHRQQMLQQISQLYSRMHLGCSRIRAHRSRPDGIRSRCRMTIWTQFSRF